MAYSVKTALCNKLCNAVLSGKPTFVSALLNDGWVAATDPKADSQRKTTRRWFWNFLVAKSGINQGQECLILCLNQQNRKA